MFLNKTSSKKNSINKIKKLIYNIFWYIFYKSKTRKQNTKQNTENMSKKKVCSFVLLFFFYKQINSFKCLPNYKVK